VTTPQECDALLGGLEAALAAAAGELLPSRPA